LQRRSEINWKVVNILEVLVREYERAARISWQPPPLHLHPDAVILVQDLQRMLTFKRLLVPAEGTVIVLGSVVVHPVILPEIGGVVAYSRSNFPQPTVASTQ
jgi:hypothetical protein